MPKKTKHSNQTSYFKTSVPKMPEGYYSGDQPNPNLRTFVEQHLQEKPYDAATDKYNVRAFDTPIETTRATAIYDMHSYHQGKKPHDAIQRYIQYYTEEGDLVLDPFCGSGSTALAALFEGRDAIAIDRSPAATFITKNYCTPVNIEELRLIFDKLQRMIEPEIDWLYATRCDRCNGKAITAYTVYSQVFQCPRCMEKLALFDCAELQSETAAGKPKKISVCPYCLKRGQTEEISTRTERFGTIPVMVSYICENGCKPARDERRHNDPDGKKRAYFEQYDLGKIKEIDSLQIPYWYPKNRMMNAPEEQARWGVKWRAGTSNFRRVDELFTKRNLWALALIRNEILKLEDRNFRDLAAGALTGVMLHLSRMSHHKEAGGGIMVGTYYVPQMFKERNAFASYSDKLKDVVTAVESGIQYLKGKIIISTQSACSYPEITSSSIDYIFTDPPYGDRVQYGELNFVWEAWLEFDTHWQREEIIVNDVRGKVERDWANMMSVAMSECYRVLKPGRWLTLCYHDTSEGTWALVQDIMAEVGFTVDKSDTALFIGTEQKSYNQYTADKVTKRDLVINFRKPKAKELGGALQITGDEDETTFNDKVYLIIHDYLLANPGVTQDRIYDEVVSRMVRAGQMQAHNFAELLAHVAEPTRGDHVSGQWYLKESEAAVDSAETKKEDAAARTLSAFIARRLKANPDAEGVHYSDLFEEYLMRVHDKPRRALADWVPDYFFKTDEGTWRLPADEDAEKLKANARASGANRRIKRFVSFLQQGIPVPDKERPSDATLAEWIRQSKRSGMFEYGKLIYEKGGMNLDALPEELLVNVEEDYQTCVRMLARDK